MKKIKLFKTLLIAIGLLATGLTSQAWADAKERYVYVGISDKFDEIKTDGQWGFNFWGGTSEGVKSGTWIENITRDGRTYHMYRVQVHDDNNKTQFKVHNNWWEPDGGVSVTLNGTTANAVFFTHGDNDGNQWKRFTGDYQVESTASLEKSTNDSVAIGATVTLTPSLSTNEDYNEITSTSYSVSTNPNDAGSVTSAGVFSATKSGVYVVTATVTYNAKDFTGITSTTTATATIRVYATITLDKQSGSSGTSTVNAVYGSAMPDVTIPSYTGKKFEGYYASAGGSGTRYYHYNGVHNGTSDILTNTSIYANWKTPTEYTLYYAVSASTVKSNTVKYNINFGYDQGWISSTMSLTDYTYNGKIIYSATVTANYESFDQIYFWPKGSSTDQEEARHSYIFASSLNGKMFVEGSSVDTWIAHATDDPLTVYFVNEDSWTKPAVYAWSDAVITNVAYFEDSEEMRKTDSTYNGYDIYAFTFPRAYDKIVFSDGGDDDNKTGDLNFYSNYSSGYTLYNGSELQAFGRDITIYAVPEKINGATWEEGTHTLYANFKVGDSEWSFKTMSKTSNEYTYDGNPIYECSLLIKYSVIKKVEFMYAADKSLYDYTPSPDLLCTEVEGKMFIGYIDDTHTWASYATDIALDQQGGSGGTSSVTATVGSAMPSATMPVTSKSGYTFAGYFKNAGGDGKQYYNSNGSSANSWDGEPKTIYAKWTQNISLDREGGTTGDESLAATYKAVLSTGSLTLPAKAGYDFAGYWTGDNGTGDMVINASGVVQTVASWTDSDKKWIHDGASTLHAKWTPVALTFSTEGNWGTAGNWETTIGAKAACVPTKDHEVTISAAVTVSGAAVAKSIAFDGGSLTISSTGALEVAGTITNTDASKINIAAGGALIFDNKDEEHLTYATVDLSTTYAGNGKFQFIAIPVYGVSVSSAFAGSDVYTYVWKQGEGWEQRGYYDDLSAFDAIALKGSSGHTFSGALVSTDDIEYGMSYSSEGYGDVYMYGNSWTAPIMVSAMTVESSDAGAVHIWNGNAGSWDGAISRDYIPALQAFAVLCKSGGGSVTIPYDNAVRKSASHNVPLKAPAHTTSDITEPMTLYVSGNDLKTRIRLFENEQFSDKIDKGYEAIHMEGEGRAGELFAQAEEKMNVLATDNLEGTVVGFIPGEATNYTISFEGDGRGYYLNDIKEEEATLIEEGNTYEFTSDESTNATRFVVSKTPIAKTPTSVDNINDGVKARKQMIDGVLYIIRDGRLYNTTGALVK